MTRPGVLVVGDVMADIIVRPDGPLVRGSDRRAEIVRRHGGSGGTQAVWLARFGVKVTLAGRVGAADLDTYRDYFKSQGVTPALAADQAHPTGTLISIVDADGERSFLTDRGANLELSPADVPATLLANAGLLVCSGYSLFADKPRATLERLIEAARRAGTGFAVDPASASFLSEFGPDRFLDVTKGAAMLFPNQEEAGLLTAESDVNRQLEILLQHYPLVAIKRGADGAIASERMGAPVSLPSADFAVRDSTGAGDAFLARFIASRLDGAALGKCLQAAIEAGSAAAAMLGGQPSPPTAA